MARRHTAAVRKSVITPPAPGAGITRIFKVGDSIAAQDWDNPLADLIQARTGTRPALSRHAFGGTRLGTAAVMAGVAAAGTVVGGSIPTSGAVEWRPADPELDISESGVAIPRMSIAGVEGTLRRTGTRTGPLMFTRKTTGAVVPAGGNQPLVHLEAVLYHNSATVVCILVGPHNNRIDALAQYPDHALGQPYIPNLIAQMASYWTGPFFVGGLTSGPTVPEGDPDYTTIFGSNGYGGATAGIQTAAGTSGAVSNWIDLRAGLISTSADPNVSAYSYNGIAITADIIDQTGSGKKYPHFPTMRMDQLGHLTDAGHRWYAKKMYDKFIEAGLI